MGWTFKLRGLCQKQERAVVSRTKKAPTINFPVTRKSNSIIETRLESTTEMEVAKHFRMLSAYFITAATISPPPKNKPK